MDPKLVDDILSKIRSHKSDFEVHTSMFEIFEGNLSKHLDEWLRGQLSAQSYHYAAKRKSPINVLRKIVDKLSSIYQQNPKREVIGGSSRDEELLRYYEDSFKIDQNMNRGNEFFNMARSTLMQPYVHMGKPRLRAIPNDRYFVYSNDEVDPVNPTHVMTSDVTLKANGDKEIIWYVYSDEEMVVIDQEGMIRSDIMNKLENPEGINPFGKIPFVYVNRSANLLIPPADVDAYNLTMLIPGLLTDLNYASMFTLFSIIYGIDIDDQGLERAPNAIWQFFSDPENDKKPEIGTIKPEADVPATLELVKSQLAFWMQTRNIRPGTIGEVEGGSFASAVSKMVDDADTTEERKKQVDYFSNAESDLWDLVINYMHPHWVSTGQIDERMLFSTSASVTTSFQEQIPLMSRGDIVRNLQAEVEAGFNSRRRAIKTLNPKFSDAEIEELIREMDEENGLVINPGELRAV